VEEILSEDFLKRLQQLLQDDKNVYKHSNYEATVEHADEMSWHVYGKKPVRLLNRARPREDPAITAYRLDSYEPITQSVCKKALSIVHKIFDTNLYSVHFEDSAEAKALKDYTTEYYPEFNSLMNYLANFVMKKMMGDPNAILLVQPYNYEILGAERVKPIVTSYSSCDIHLVDPNYFLLFDSFIELNKVKEWRYTYVDRVGVYKLLVTWEAGNMSQTISVAKMGFPNLNNGQNIEVSIEQQYIHNFGEMPLWYLSGEYSDKNYGLFDSFFQPAVPFWNEAINDHSDVTGGYRNHMWPHKWEIADECEYVEENAGGRYACQGGYIFNGTVKHKCPSCGGAGYATAKSPYETTLINRDKFNSEGPSGGQVPLGYVTVPTDALQMLETKAENNLLKGLDALSMNLEVGANQSGKAKEMDRSELNDFLQRISDVCFELHLKNMYYFFAKYMFSIDSPEKVEKIEPEISKPTQFDVYSSTELTAQFAEAKKAKLNPSYLTTKQAEIQNKEFSTNPLLLNRLNLELLLDPFAEVDPNDLNLMLNNGTVTKKDVIIHNNIKKFIGRAMEEESGFINKRVRDQIATLEKYADEVIQANKVTIDTSAIDTQPAFGQGGQPNN